MIIDRPIVIAICMAKTSGRNTAKTGNPLKINKAAINNINKAGKKIIAFAKTIETGKRYCGKLDSLMRFLLSTRLVAALISES